VKMIALATATVRDVVCGVGGSTYQLVVTPVRDQYGKQLKQVGTAQIGVPEEIAGGAVVALEGREQSCCAASGGDEGEP